MDEPVFCFTYLKLLLFVDIDVKVLLNAFLLLVLEFELRKAHDTIKSLRASLTKSAGKYLCCSIERLEFKQ